jgi:hypothetical protein
MGEARRMSGVRVWAATLSVAESLTQRATCRDGGGVEGGWVKLALVTDARHNTYTDLIRTLLGVC